jgi:hypothetical protein
MTTTRSVRVEPGSHALRVVAGAALALLIAAACVAGARASDTHPQVNDQIPQVELARLHALVDADVATARSLMAPDLQVITPAGAALGRDDYLAAVQAGVIDYLAFEPTSEITVRRSGDAAALRYQVHFDLVAGGTRLTHEGWITELYERRDGRWQIVWEQATAVPNRFNLLLRALKPRNH